MHCLVTGGCGFIGQHLVIALRQRGHQVRVLDLKSGTTAGVEYLQGDLRDETLATQACQAIDWVFHTAALPSLWLANKADYESVNHQGTRRLLAAARSAAVKRFIHTSTEAIYRAPTELADSALNNKIEQMPGPYARSKLAAEQTVLAAAREGFDALTVAPTQPLGPGDGSLTPPSRLLLVLLKGRHRAYLEWCMNLVDVRDVALGHVLAAEQGKRGERYLLAGEPLFCSALIAQLKGLTSAQLPQRRVPGWLAQAVAATNTWLADHITRRPPLAPLEGLRIARLGLPFDATKARRELGFTNRPLAVTLADTLADFRARGLVALA